jgi:hypothetical protein
MRSAQITWNGKARTYTVHGQTFVRDQNFNIENDVLIDYCKSTLGFSVTEHEQSTQSEPEKKITRVR